MRRPLPAQQGVPEVAGVVRKWVDLGIMAGEPSGEQIDAQGKSVHLRKQRDDKCGEGAERSPIARRPRARETQPTTTSRRPRPYP